MKVVIILLIFLISISSSKKEKLRQNHHSAKTKKSNVSLLKSEHDEFFRAVEWELNHKGTVRQKFGAFAATRANTLNFVSSPVSALLPLGKLALGASGECLSQLHDATGVSSHAELKSSFKKLVKDLQYIPGVKLSLASRIYISETSYFELNTDFEKHSKNVFNSAVERTSFDNPAQITREINDWVSKETHGTIPRLLTPSQISTSESMVLVNAIYFKGRWKKPFKNVVLDTFYTVFNSKTITKFLKQEGYYKYGTHPVLNSQIVEIPYEGDRASFIILLPSPHSSLRTLLLQLKLAPNLLAEALKNMTSQSVRLKIPKFQVTGTTDLLNVYGELGLSSLNKRDSCLTKIVKNTKIWVTNAVQKAHLEIHETGTEATAASGTNITPIKAILNLVVFNANRPFMFLIQSKGEQLFSGTYYEP